MILCIGTTPAAQRVMCFKKLELDAVNRAAATLDGIAGKSINVAKVLKTLGAQPIATGFLGGPRGQEIMRELGEKSIECAFVAVPTPTRQCVTVIDEGAGKITELVEESGAVAPAGFEELRAVIRGRMQGCRAVVMSGTMAAGGPPEFYAECTQLARERGALSAVDAQGVALTEALKARPGLVKPNRRELEQTVSRSLSTEAEVVAAMRDMQGSGAERMIVTAGKEPALAFDGVCFWRIRPPRIRAVNPIGSGDAFTAGVIWSLLRGDDLGEACRWGAAAGAANALSLMPGEVELSEVQRLAPGILVEKIMQ